MLVPKLRFKREDGTDYPEWEEKEVRDCLVYEQPAKYIVKSEQYNDNYETPVLTANKGFILGYTNEKDGIYSKGDVIIYDDFTMDMKYVWFAFKVKSSAMKMLTAINDNNLYFMYSLLVSHNLHQEVHSRSYISQVEPMLVQIPCLEEQRKIADYLSTVDEVIAQSEAEVQNLEQQKKAAMQKIFSQEIRFKREDGMDYPEWEEKEVRDCLVYEQPTKYIVKSEQYNDNYETPVLTANKGFILGYTNEKDGIYNKGDVIIYDDFTMDMKYVWFAFKVKSSAMKMLTAINDNNLYFMYSLLVSHNLHQEVHSRSYISQVEPMLAQIPCLEEQQKIADFLSTYDKAIRYAKQELDKWKELKKGLLQQMFV